MIPRTVKQYCCEDPSLIENYYKAINDDTQIWVIHHRLETAENKTRDQLKAEGRYFNRPASELIFLTKSEHHRLHNKDEKNPCYGRTGEKNSCYGRTGEKNPMYGKTGEKAYCYGHCWMTNGIDRIYPKREESYKYLELGYQYGTKLKNT